MVTTHRNSASASAGLAICAEEERGFSGVLSGSAPGSSPQGKVSRASNRWLSRVAKAEGEACVERAVQTLVSRFRRPNEDLYSLAEQFGIRRIVCEELPFEGGIYLVDGNRTIKINSLSSEAKR